MAQRGIKVGRRESLRTTLIGPAGTGKTSIARIIAKRIPVWAFSSPPS
jgi:replication-associated recombination protein RarA